MGLKNELLGKKEEVHNAVDNDDVELLSEIVRSWRQEGWDYCQIREQIKQWTNMDPSQLYDWEGMKD